MLKRFSNDKLADRGPWKCPHATHILQSRILLIVRITVKPSERKLLVEIDKNVTKLFNVPKVTNA